MGYLDKIGLARLWSNVKTYVESEIEKALSGVAGGDIDGGYPDKTMAVDTILLSMNTKEGLETNSGDMLEVDL